MAIETRSLSAYRFTERDALVSNLTVAGELIALLGAYPDAALAMTGPRRHVLLRALGLAQKEMFADLAQTEDELAALNKRTDDLIAKVDANNEKINSMMARPVP